MSQIKFLWGLILMLKWEKSSPNTVWKSYKEIGACPHNFLIFLKGVLVRIFFEIMFNLVYVGSLRVCHSSY